MPARADHSRSAFTQLMGWLILAGALLGTVGCGGGGPKKARIYGKVTMDGQPIVKGRIGFVPADSKGPQAGTEIKDGKYEVDVPVGRMRVEIYSPVVVGKKPVFDKPNSPTLDVFGEGIPVRYNEATTLYRDIKSREEMNFDLSRKE